MTRVNDRVSKSKVEFKQVDVWFARESPCPSDCVRLDKSAHSRKREMPTRPEESARTEAIEAGPNNYLSKPFGVASC
jgi:hypothetical protein